MKNAPLLIADIGGTNARFALAAATSPYYEFAQTLQCVDYKNIEQAIYAYLSSHEISSLQGICLAVAGPVHDQSVRLTNNHWVINAANLKSQFATDRVHLLNDFESIAYSLRQLGEADLSEIGESRLLDTSKDFTVGVVGPGSGLGIAGLYQRSEILHQLTTEGGHVGFYPDNELQKVIMQCLGKKFKRVSNERLLSGPGLVNIHEALCEINDKPNPGFSPADIAEESNPLCMQSMEVFFEVLGQVAGDTALALGAYQGIYIGGGIVQRYPNQLERSKFRAAFERKGRFRSLMEGIPTWLITHKNPGLLGSGLYARSYLVD